MAELLFESIPRPLGIYATKILYKGKRIFIETNSEKDIKDFNNFLEKRLFLFVGGTGNHKE